MGMSGQRRQQRGKGRDVQLQHGGGFAKGEHLQLFDQLQVRRGKGEGAAFGQRVQRAAAAVPFRLQHQHDFAARGGRLKFPAG